MNKEAILEKTTYLFAMFGYEGVSMRTLAKELDIAQSVLYHYFSGKDALLEEMFDLKRKELGEKRRVLPQVSTAEAMLEQRVKFQLDNAEAVIAILKYYMHFRDTFKKNKQGYLPQTAYKHIEEVLEFGETQGTFIVTDRMQDSKVITHAINGFVLEYYPAHLSNPEKDRLVQTITAFLLRALQHDKG